MTRPTGVALRDLIVDIRPGFASGKEDAGGVFQVRMNNITRSGAFDLTKRRRVPRDHAAIPSTLLQAGDVLFNATNSPDLVGKTAIALDLDEPTVFSNHFLKLRANESRLHPGYLARWLQHQFKLGVFRSMCRQWVNQATVSRDALLSMKIPLITLGAQRRVVGLLDRVDALRIKRRETLACLDELGQSIFLDMFGDPVVNSRTWPLAAVGDLGLVITGNTPSRAVPEYYGDEIEWIKSDNIKPENTFLAPASEKLSVLGMSQARVAEVGSLLVTCIAGSPASIGNAAIANRKVAFNQQINAIVPDEADVRFLHMLFRLGKSLVQERSTGGMKGLVSKSQFASIKIISPPLPLQQEFARRIRALSNLSDASDSHRRLLDGLFDSLQDRGFCGKL